MLTIATGALLLALILVGVSWFIFQRGNNTHLHGAKGLENQGYDGHLPNHSFTEAVPFLWLTNKVKELGSRIDIRLGSQRVITVNEISLIKEVTNDPSFQGRPSKCLEAYGLVAGGSSKKGSGLINNDGATYQQLRKRSEQLLRSVGVGQKPLDFEIHREIDSFLERLDGEVKTKGGIFECSSEMFMRPVFNVLWCLLAGEQIPKEDSKELLNNIQGALMTAKSNRYFHYMTHKKEAEETQGSECQLKVERFIKNLVELRKNQDLNYQVSRESNFIDLWLKSSGTSLESTDILVAVVKDLVIKGTEPVAATLAWTIYFLSQNQRALASLQEEIDRIVGSGGIPSIKDRPQMPYTIAVLMETLRRSSIFPVGLLRSTTDEVPNFNGHSIPSDTTVIVNYYAAHHNADKWADAETFNPDRFIQRSPDGVKLMRSESSIPFSLGKRSCIGELLAKEELFLFITSIFQKFTFELVSNGNVTIDKWAEQREEAFFRTPPQIRVRCMHRAK